MRIAIDIDSTLHHYWDQFQLAARRRFGVDLPYRDQPWRIDRLRPEQVSVCIAETHRDEQILAAEPYPGAVEVVRRWREAGHWIHITSHRAAETCEATARWLERIDLPYDDLHCSYDKIARCVELEIDVLVDDSPVNLTKARERGIVGATLIHPWTREIATEDGVISGKDWYELAEKLEPVIGQ